MAEDGGLSLVNVQIGAETDNPSTVFATDSTVAGDRSMVDAPNSTATTNSAVMATSRTNNPSSVGVPANGIPSKVNTWVTGSPSMIDTNNLGLDNTGNPNMVGSANLDPKNTNDLSAVNTSHQTTGDASADKATGNSNVVNGPATTGSALSNAALIPLPPVEAALFRLEPVSGWSEIVFPPFRHLDGTLIRDQRGKEFKDYPFLPRHIPAKSPAYLLELWLGKSDARVQTRDLFVRMNPPPSKAKLAANAINMQRVRFRTHFNIPCWTKRPAVPTQIECLVYEQLTWDSVVHNTILPVLGGVGLVMPALPDSLTATQPLVLPLTTYTRGQGSHAPSQRVRHVFDIIATLQDTAFERGYSHWIFLENKYKPEAWSTKAVGQHHRQSGPNEIAVPSFLDFPDAARSWIEEGVREAARNRSFLPPLSKLPDVSRKQVYSIIAKVANVLNRSVVNLLPAKDSARASKINPLSRPLPAPSYQPFLLAANSTTQSFQSVQSLQPTQNTPPMPKDRSAKGNKPVMAIQTMQNDLEDEWTDTSASDTDMEETVVNNDHVALTTFHDQQIDDEDDWTDVSSSDTETGEVVAKNDHAVRGTSGEEPGQASATTEFIAMNNANDQRFLQLGASTGQQGQIDVVGKHVARAENGAVNGRNNPGVQKAVSSGTQAGVTSNLVPLNANGSQLVRGTMATGNTARAAYTSPYPQDSANGGTNYGALGPHLEQFGRANVQFSGGPSVSTAQNDQGVPGTLEISNPAASVRRRPRPLLAPTTNPQAITDTLQLPPIVRGPSAPAATGTPNGQDVRGVIGSLRLAPITRDREVTPIATTPNGQEAQGVADTLQLAPMIHPRPAPVVAASQTDPRAQANVAPRNQTAFVRRRAAPSAAAQSAREAQAAAESFDPSSFLRRRVATETTNQDQGQIQFNGGAFHTSMIGPYLERFNRENAHLVRQRSASATEQPANGNKRRKL